MKLILAIKPKIKIAVILLVLVIIILSTSLFERHFFHSVNQSSASIYNDRLVPANEMFLLADQMLERHLLVDDFLSSPEKITEQETEALLAQHKKTIAQLLDSFEATYLVKAETKSLNELKRHLENYTAVENKVIASKQKPPQLHLLRTEFMRVHEELKTLSAIQISVGEDLFSASNQSISDADAISDLQIIIIIILCILAQIFILSSKSIASPINQKHHLN